MIGFSKFTSKNQNSDEQRAVVLGEEEIWKAAVSHEKCLRLSHLKNTQSFTLKTSVYKTLF